ncbi:hypothetical protein [Aeromonas sp. ASNIH2]|nr:hypothetical protein [Aeromonas sp. ASNIH2]
MSAQEKLTALLASIADRLETMDIQLSDRCILERELGEAKALATNRQ